MKKIATQKLAFFQEAILVWYDEFGRHQLPWRKSNLSSYDIIIAEVLLQRTKAETVQKFYVNFLEQLPNWQSIVLIDITSLEELLKPVGLYRQRARRLKDLAADMIARNEILPESRSELNKIPLFGQYIANAIELQVFNRPLPLLDVNMARVLERYFGERKMADIRYDPYLQSLANSVVKHRRILEVNWAILDFAAAICKAVIPMCKKCILTKYCTFYKNNITCAKF